MELVSSEVGAFLARTDRDWHSGLPKTEPADEHKGLGLVVLEKPSTGRRH